MLKEWQWVVGPHCGRTGLGLRSGKISGDLVKRLLPGSKQEMMAAWTGMAYCRWRKVGGSGRYLGGKMNRAC